MKKINGLVDRVLSRLLVESTARAAERCSYIGWWTVIRDGQGCYKWWTQQRTDCTQIRYPSRPC